MVRDPVSAGQLRSRSNKRLTFGIFFHQKKIIDQMQNINYSPVSEITFKFHFPPKVHYITLWQVDFLELKINPRKF